MGLGDNNAEAGASSSTAQARLAAIVECSDDAIISKSLDGIVTSWNGAAERIFGYKADEIIGRPILSIIPEDRRPEEQDILARLQRGERIDHFNTVRLTKDGRNLDVLVSISPIKDETGKIVGASKTLRDLSAARKAEQAVRDSEARVRAVVDSAADGILTIDEQGIIELINPAGVRTFGYSAEEVIGKNIKMLMPEPYFSEHDGYLAHYRETGERKVIGIGRDVMGKRKDQSTFPADLAVSEVQLGDRRIFTGIVRDITKRKEAERALVEEKERAEAASLAKEHFLSVLSHELRTPLAPAIAELSFLQERADLPEELRNQLGMVRRNLETEARLVDDLLDLTRIGRGKIELHVEVVDLHETVRAVLLMYKAPILAKSLDIRLSLRAAQHHVWADPGRVQQILLNLLSNAVKFSSEGGSISIDSEDVGEEFIRLDIRDTGVGFDAAMQERLFGAFEQSQFSRRLGGLGLGLSIARSLAQLHDGDLTASSEGKDRGSVFSLKLKTVPAVDRPAHASAPQAAVRFDQRILLVEDHEDTRKVMARVLKHLGCHVTTAGSVREAIAAAELHTFDLLISDIGLPDGSGLEVMKHFKQRQIKGIALSGFGQEEDIQRSREAGFELHMTKPLNFSVLKDVLRKVNRG